MAKFNDEQIEKYERSATELECNDGVFKAESDHAFCYFRTITNYDEIDEHRKTIFCEKDDESQHLLKNLKKRLVKQIPTNQIYKFNASFKKGNKTTSVTNGHLKSFCNRVEADLTRVIQSEIDKFEEQTDLEKEIDAHNKFRLDRVKGFLGCESVKSEIQEYIRKGINHCHSALTQPLPYLAHSAIVIPGSLSHCHSGLTQPLPFRA